MYQCIWQMSPLQAELTFITLDFESSTESLSSSQPCCLEGRHKLSFRIFTPKLKGTPEQLKKVRPLRKLSWKRLPFLPSRASRSSDGGNWAPMWWPPRSTRRWTCRRRKMPLKLSGFEGRPGNEQKTLRQLISETSMTVPSNRSQLLHFSTLQAQHLPLHILLDKRMKGVSELLHGMCHTF